MIASGQQALAQGSPVHDIYCLRSVPIHPGSIPGSVLRVKGQVLDAVTLQPVPEITVKFQPLNLYSAEEQSVFANWTATTNKDGHFASVLPTDRLRFTEHRITPLRSVGVSVVGGEYLLIRKPGDPHSRLKAGCPMPDAESPSDEEFVRVDGSNGTVELRMFAARPATVRGRILGPDGTPAAGASVSIDPYGWNLVRQSDESGNYSFERVPAGEYLVKVSPADSRRSEIRYALFDPTRLFDLRNVNRIFGLERFYASTPLYYPGVADLAHAQKVLLVPGGTAVVDMQLIELERFATQLRIRRPLSAPIYAALKPEGKDAARRPYVMCGSIHPNADARFETLDCGEVAAGPYIVQIGHMQARKLEILHETKIVVERMSADAFVINFQSDRTTAP